MADIRFQATATAQAIRAAPRGPVILIFVVLVFALHLVLLPRLQDESELPESHVTDTGRYNFLVVADLDQQSKLMKDEKPAWRSSTRRCVLFGC